MVACEIVLLKKSEKKLETIAEEYIIGTVKWFDNSKEFGFISIKNYDNDYFIHKSDLLSETSISEGDIVVFKEKSKKGKFSAIKCQSFFTYLNNSFEITLIILQKYLSEMDKIDFNKIKLIAQSNKINEIIKKDFLNSVFEKLSTENQVRMVGESIIHMFEGEQIELLQKYLDKLGKLHYSQYEQQQSEYEQVKYIIQSDGIYYTAKQVFLKPAFRQLSYRYGNYEYTNTIIKDCLVYLQVQEQTELLEIYLSKNLTDYNDYRNDYMRKYDDMISVIQSDGVDERAKITFIKSVFEELKKIEFKFRILVNYLVYFSEEEQDKLLQEYAKEVTNYGGYGQPLISEYYENVKSIAQYNEIDEIVKIAFFQSVFERVSTSYQCKLVSDGLVDFSELEQDELLQKQAKKINYGRDEKTLTSKDYEDIKYIGQSDKIYENVKIAFLQPIFGRVNNNYKCSMVSDGLIYLLEQEQIELIQKYLKETDNIRNSDYEQIKSIAQSDNIHNTVKAIFIPSVFEKFELRSKHDMLFKDNLIEYSQVSKIDRLRLWLENLNPHYDYLEFVQTIWQLSNSDRKLFNKRVKQQAKNERLQQFMDKIPSAKIIEETEDTITYRCKWRNLYYKNGLLQVFLNRYNSTEDYPWESAREQWNLLTQEYFNNRRIDDIIVTVKNNHVIQITGLEDIETKIVIAEIRKNGTANRRTTISSSEFLRLIHNVSARNQCINFLASQNSEYNVVDIQELVKNEYGAYTRDVSFLFPISNGNGSMYLIWESVEFEKSKATHIFKCSEEEFEETESKIKEFIESNTLIRSRLNSSEYDHREIQKDLRHLCKVDHPNEYQIWEDRMKEVLPFLI